MKYFFSIFIASLSQLTYLSQAIRVHKVTQPGLLTELLQVESSTEQVPGMEGPPPPVPCNSPGHLNTPVINIVDKSQKTEHSHAFAPPYQMPPVRPVMPAPPMSTKVHHGGSALQ